MLCLSLALYLFVVARKQPAYSALAALPLAFSYVIRPTNSISIALLSVYMFLVYRRYFGFYLLGLAVIAVPFAFYNFGIYTQIIPPYYFPSRLGSPFFLEALLGNMISPSRGLLVFTPVLALSFYGFYLRISGQSLKKIFLKLEFFLLVAILLHWVAISAYVHWYGGWSIGPRFFSDMTPYLIFLLIPVVEKLPLSIPAFLEKKALTLTFVCLALFSIYVHGRSSTNFEPLLWNGYPTDIDASKERLWNWSDLQFLRGMCQPPEYQAPACWQ